MTQLLSEKDTQYALSQFFIDPVITKTQFFKMGAENTTALIKTNFGAVVLRVWGEQHSRMGARKISDIEGELAFMDACRAAQVPVPKIYTSLSGNEYEELPGGQKYAVMDYIEGEEPAHFSQPMIEALATAIAHMNIVGQTFRYPEPRSFTGTVVEFAQERISEYRLQAEPDEFVESLIKKLERGLSQTDLTKLPFGPVHGDVMYQNVKFNGDQLSGIFDFDDCRESYLIEDITKTLYFAMGDPAHCVLGNDIANARLFIAAYERVRSLSESEKTALPVLSLARYIYELLKLYNRRNEKPEAAEMLNAKKSAYAKFKPLFEERI